MILKEGGITIAVTRGHTQTIEIKLAIILDDLGEESLTIMPSCSVSNCITGRPALVVNYHNRVRKSRK
jgi:hypothetical protein